MARSTAREAKFNLVGPDLSSAEWAALLKPLPGQIVVVNTTAASFPVPRASRRPAPRRHHRDRLGRAAVRHGLPRILHPRADRRRSRPRQERARLDLGGVRRGEHRRAPLFHAARPARDRARADRRQRRRRRPGGGRRRQGRFGVEPPVPGSGRRRAPPPTDEELLQLLQKRAALQIEADELKQRRQLMTPDEY